MRSLHYTSKTSDQVFLYTLPWVEPESSSDLDSEGPLNENQSQQKY